MDDFGVKYVNKEDVDHLMSALKEHYTVTEDWKGERYIGMHLRLDYAAKKVHPYMPSYVYKALKQFHHEPLNRQQDSPYIPAPMKYGTKAQYAEQPKDSPPLDKSEKSSSSKVTGKFLLLGRAGNSTLLTPLSDIASRNKQHQQKTSWHAQIQSLDYLAP